KVAGILTELSAELDSVKHVVLGFGVNVNLTAADLPPDLKKLATSLRIELGRMVDRAGLAAAILRALDVVYERVIHGEFDRVADEWEAQCTTIGHEIMIQIGERKVCGRAESLDPAGALLLRTHHGHLERIVGGDVTLQK